MTSRKRPLEEIEGEEDQHDAGPSPQSAPRLSLENFERGSIIKIRVKNFMTYDEAVFKPGPRLNLILAPNGTGKSSLTCALCLGLAGHPSILGRADNPRDFIQKGTNEAITEITLSSGNPERPIVIQRRLTKDNTRYRINGVDKNKAEVQKILKDLNIQLDNLCQFLPQDKVVGFAQMKPGELLMESERAMGDARLHRLHNELIEDRNDLKTYERSAGALQRNLEDEERIMNELQRDKERYEQRRELLQKADLMEKKGLYMDYVEAQDKLKETKAKIVQGKERLEQIRAEIARDQAPLLAKQQEESRVKKEAQAHKRVVIDREGALGNIGSKSEDVSAQLTKKWDEIEGLRAQAEQRAEQLARLDAEVARLQAELDELPAEPARATQGTQGMQSDEIRELRGQVSALNDEARGFESDMGELREQLHSFEREMKNFQEQLARLDSVRDNKLRQLEQFHRGITAFTHWVADNKARFRGEVYGPILLEVTVKDPQYAKYLEHQLPRHIWPRFVTMYREDQDELQREADRAGFRGLLTTNFAGSPNGPLRYPDGQASQYASFDIKHTLDEVFEAPPVIKHILSDECSITRAFVGTARTDVDALQRAAPKVMNLYTPESSYRTKVSAYNSAARSQRVSAIMQQCQWLTTSHDNTEERAAIIADSTKTQQQVDAIKSELQAMNAAKKDAEARVSEKRKELQKAEAQASKLKHQRMKLVSQIRSRKKQQEDVRKKPDPMSRQPALRRDIDRLNTQAHNLVLKIASALEGQWEAMKLMACSDAHALELHAQIAALKERAQGGNERLRRMENLLQQLVQVEKRDEEETRRRKKIAKDACQLTDEIKAFFRDLPSDKEELQQQIDELHGQAAAIQCANPRIMQEYEERSARIRKLREEFGGETDNLNTLTAALEAKKVQWLPELKRMVGVVSHHFSRNMRAIGCAGEVQLYCGCDAGFDSCNNFDKYAVNIMVKFRDEEEMQLLTANRQSGGERAVCTILYIIALQYVTVCPFRVVDEINQGMDQINERKVFVRMVEAACRPGTPQCFMFTPKLLPDLPYTRDVYPMSIFNGVHCSALTQEFHGAGDFVTGMPVVYTG
ncbi:Structural maintenance of chromosomes protein 5 [Coccomyxa sp. Obi]|nr:Structural maintenance of chromosomes protein 5 [Coccomyxa sp. Obi]